MINSNKYFIVVPAYNEFANIKNVISGICKNSRLRVVVVDDGSKDNTFKMVNKIQGVEILRHKVNIGKGAAMKTGCEYAFSKGARAVIFMDSDAQHSSEDIVKFTKALDSGNQVVFGSRNYGYGTPLVRFLGNKAASVLISLLYGIYVSDLLCGFRALTLDAYKKIKWESPGYGVETEMVIKTANSGLKYCEVPVAAIYLDKVKGVTILDALSVLLDVFRWKFRK